MKYWKVLMAGAMLFGLASCGGGDDSDKNTPPPPVAGDAGSVVFAAKAPTFIQVDNGSGAQVEKLAVDFTLKDAQGNPVEINEPISFSVTKLMPGREQIATDGKVFTGPTYWKAFTYSAKTSNGVTVYKPDFEKSDSSTLENLGNGHYRYTFKTDFNNTVDPYATDSANNGGLIAWDADKTHRLAVYFGASTQDSTVPLVNYTQDWVPAGGEPTLTRDILEQVSCDSCHMGQPIHHQLDVAKGRAPKGSDPKLCVNCHNDSNPGSGRKSLTVLAHQFHSAGKDNIDSTKAVGGNYPQDPRNCDTCHKPETVSTPDATNWTVPTEVACKACHGDYYKPDTAEKMADHYPGRACTDCHKDENNKKGATNAHFGRLEAMKAGAATLKLDIQHASYNVNTKAITVELYIGKDGVGINDIVTDLIPFTYGTTKYEGGLATGNGNPSLLVNWNEGDGDVLGGDYKDAKISLATGCQSHGSGNFICTTKPLTRVPADNAELTVTITDMGLCVNKKGNTLDAGTAGLIPCPAFSTIQADRFEYIMAPQAPVAHFDLGGAPIDHEDYIVPVGADMAQCASCHKDSAFHFSASPYDHAATDLNQCANCHNANRSSATTADLKSRVHRFHASADGLEEPFFPGKVNNCESCHTKDQYNIPNQKNARASVAQATDSAGNKVDKYFSPTLVVCASCHLKSELVNVNPDTPAAGDEWASHMKENGAKFGTATREEATGQETCADCHAIGQDQGVDKVHKVFDFR